MGQVKGKTYRFEASPSPDVVGYTLYWERVDEGVTADFSYQSLNKLDLGIPDSEQRPSGTTYVVALGQIPKIVGDEGTFSFAVAAYDAAGNHSSFGGRVDNVALDFQPPEAPGAGSVSDS